MENRSLLHHDTTMNVSWFAEELEFYGNQSGFFTSIIFTAARFVTLVMAVIAHRAFYKLMKRLPGRAINQIIYPYMVNFLFFTILQSHNFTTLQI